MSPIGLSVCFFFYILASSVTYARKIPETSLYNKSENYAAYQSCEPQKCAWVQSQYLKKGLPLCSSKKDWVCCDLGSSLTTDQSQCECENEYKISCDLEPVTLKKPVKGKTLKAKKKVNLGFSGRIAKGYDVTSDTDTSFMVKIIVKRFDDEEFDLICSGALLSCRYVVTAAHCLRYQTRNRIIKSLTIGDWNKSPNGEFSVYACKYWIHPNFITEKSDDIALIQLEGFCNFKRANLTWLTPIANDREELIGLKVTVKGWGATSNSNPFTDTLQETKMTVKSLETCKDIFPVIYEKKNTDWLCMMGVNMSDTCRGDSGGPLTLYSKKLQKYLLVAVVAGGLTGCFSGERVSTATPISPYIDWINAIINSREKNFKKV